MKTIVTHDGVFHADDVMAVAMIELYEGRTCDVVRTRDPVEIAKADYVVDVGGVYDGPTLRFDHHQKGFDLRRPSGVKFSSAGLVWNRLAPLFLPMAIVNRVDTILVEGICALDNGQAPAEDAGVCRIASVSSLISAFNPSWRSPHDAESAYTAFMKAVVFAHGILERATEQARSWVAARDIVMNAIDCSPRGLLILNRFCPWQEHLHSLPESSDTLYTVFQAQGEGTWMVQCVPETPGSFVSRKPLPEAWAGLRDADLEAVTGVAGSVFCHNGRFIGGAKTRLGALELAEMALRA